MTRFLSIGIVWIAGLLACVSAKAKNSDDNVKLFAVATLSDPDKNYVEGDSVLVTVIIYSNYTFAQVENTDNALPKIKGTNVRAYNPDRRLVQNIANYKGQRYYSVVTEQFVVKLNETGTVEFPSRKFNVSLYMQLRDREFSPFDDFFGFGSPYRGQSKKIQKKCTSEPLKIKVSKRPPKTMHDIQQNGTILM